MSTAMYVWESRNEWGTCGICVGWCAFFSLDAICHMNVWVKCCAVVSIAVGLCMWMSECYVPFSYLYRLWVIRFYSSVCVLSPSPECNCIDSFSGFDAFCIRIQRSGCAYAERTMHYVNRNAMQTARWGYNVYIYICIQTDCLLCEWLSVYPVYVIQSVSLLSLHHALSFGLTHAILSLLPILMHIHIYM